MPRRILVGVVLGIAMLGVLDFLHAALSPWAARAASWIVGIVFTVIFGIALTWAERRGLVPGPYEPRLRDLFQDDPSDSLADDPSPDSTSSSAAATIVQALGEAFPSGTFLYLEGIPDTVFEQWLVDHAVPPRLNIRKAILWPRPECYHVPLTPALLAEAAELIERERIEIPCYHLHVHDGQQLLLRWYDAFVDTDVLISNAVPAAQGADFARAVKAALAPGDTG